MENNIGKEEKDIIANLVNKTNSQTMIIIILTIIIFVLVIGYLNIQTTVRVELPPKFISSNNKEIKYDISNDSASSDYFKIWGYYYINETSTFKSKEISKKIGLIKRAYEPNRLKLLRKDIDEQSGKEFTTSDNKELDDFIKNIRKEKVEQKFYIKKVHKPVMLYDNSEASLKIDGLATQYFEKLKSDPINIDKPCYYEIKLNRNGGTTYVVGYKTNCFD